MSQADLALFLEAAVRLGIPLAFAALGETITERSGVINIGLEGSIIAGALGGALGALAFDGAGPGVMAGAVAGLTIALVFTLFAVGLGADQIITGTAVTIGSLGMTGAVYQARFGATGTERSLRTLAPGTLVRVRRGGVQTARFLEFSFSDEGRGISEEDARKLFIPFFTTKASGTGLGLPICERIMRAHGGEIEIESRPERGTSFALRLPLSDPEETGEVDASPAPVDDTQAPGSEERPETSPAAHFPMPEG